MANPDDDIPSGIDFRDPAGVAKWLETAETKPGRIAIRQQIADLLRDRCPTPTRVLELGTGPGWLAETILGACTVSSYTLFDHSPTFLDMCRERLAHSAVTRYVLGDFKENPSWPSLVEPPFHAVVTMQAVHELRHKRHAVTLYRQVLPLLERRGLLIVCDSNPGTDARSLALHASDAEQREALTAAGFTDVELNLVDYGKYIVSARRPS
ncbi:MAG TPA: class I SAM-dependent methyltransferase [Kofleriaceae bacterium]|nr:class I SAM-dependent methyltransferase [Kofleriaceae bacterium]